MRFRTVAIAAALSVGLVRIGDAYAPHKGAERPIVAEGRAPRLHRDVAWAPLPSLPSWRVMWDRDTDVPLRLWGAPVAAPHASSDASAAESAARAFLVEHLAALAPGATAGDFALLANQHDPSGRIRTVSFAQRAFGLPVIGGAIAFTFSRDRLIMMSSTALPNISVRLPGGALPISARASAAISWLGKAGFAVDVRAHGSRVIVPIVHSRGTKGVEISYRVAETVTVESIREPGRWDVWLDAVDASPIARHSTLMFASGRVLFDTPDRYPAGTRSAKPAPEAVHTIAGAAVTSLVDGTITWADAGSISLTTGLVGPRVRVSNKMGALATDTFTLEPGSTVTWSKATDEYGDAQLSAFVAASTAKAFAKAHLNNSLAWLDGQIPVVVNEQQTCNAYSTGNDIHFYKNNSQCENTGRLADVVYHELGHSLHYNSIIDGAGSFDTSLSEGLADTLAASITDDHGMGRGFFHSDAALRDLDPVDIEKRWPDDADGEPHDEGEIIGEALWDLRKALEAKHGATEGKAKLLGIYYGIMQRAADIPSTYAEALVADDDDGDLANGTPNQCQIDAAFSAHGLTDPTVALGITPPMRDGFRISFTVRAPETTSECPPSTVESATLTWAPRAGSGGEVALAANGDTWAANIPTQPDGTVVLYHVTLRLSDGSSITYPQNRADPEYQLYVGNVTTLWCSDFEAGIGDWTIGGTPSQRIEWEVGVPTGVAGDPKLAHGGTNVLGIDLGSDDGLYYARTTQYVESPEIDLAGNTNVRLQYYRWLTSEDGVYDQSTISANGQEVWKNFTSTSQDGSGTSHTDKEWRFHDVDLSAQASAGKIKLKFQLQADEGFELGGWAMDDVCLVIAGPPSGTCGNFNIDPGESCDDGNTTDGDGCSATCDDGEGGCCSAGTNPAGAAVLSLFTLVLVLVRRGGRSR